MAQGMTAKAVAIVVVVMTLVAAGCGDDDGDAVRETGSGSGSGSGSASGSGGASGTAAGEAGCRVEDGAEGTAETEVHVELSEFAIELDMTDVPAGLVRFEVDNAGAEPHELAVVRAADAAGLATKEDGSVDDEQVDLVGEIEPFDGGTECDGTFDLMPGTYVLICNIVEEEGGETEAHFEEGMHTTLTVTG